MDDECRTSFTDYKLSKKRIMTEFSKKKNNNTPTPVAFAVKQFNTP